MFASIFKTVLFWLTRPLAKYMIYPGSISLLMGGTIQDAAMLKENLIEMGSTPIEVYTEDNRALDAMYFDVERLYPDHANIFPKEKRPTVLVCPGNGMLYPYAWSIVRFYLQSGCNVAIFNYGGYGDSEGAPTSQTTFYDVEAMYAHIHNNLGIPNERFLVHGLSLGGAPASHLAAKYPIHIILDRVFSRPGDIAKIKFLGDMTNYLYPYHNVDRVKDFTQKVLIVDAVKDRLMAPKHTNMLFDALISQRHPNFKEEELIPLRNKYVLPVPGDHNDCWLEDDPDYHMAHRSVRLMLEEIVNEA